MADPARFQAEKVLVLRAEAEQPEHAKAAVAAMEATLRQALQAGTVAPKSPGRSWIHEPDVGGFDLGAMDADMLRLERAWNAAVERDCPAIFYEKAKEVAGVKAPAGR